MKVVILAGGLPSTISEEDDKIPKPMVRVGERPLLWHIMKLYSFYGFNDFIICTGYKSEIIKDYFMNYYIYKSDITIDLQTNKVTSHNNKTEPWKVTIVYTGLNSTTAERIARAKEYIGDEDFIVSYGDCISDINIKKLVEVHKNNDKLLTLAVARPTGRSAILPLAENNNISNMSGIQSDAWANACNMVVSHSIFNYIQPQERFEVETTGRISESGLAGIYKHEGLWLPVETMRDKEMLEEIWLNGTAWWGQEGNAPVR